jgi:hypothetical protein
VCFCVVLGVFWGVNLVDRCCRPAELSSKRAIGRARQVVKPTEWVSSITLVLSIVDSLVVLFLETAGPSIRRASRPLE